MKKRLKARHDKRNGIAVTTDARYYEHLLSNANIQAFLKVIRKGEGTLGSHGYEMLVGKHLFNNFSKFPNVLNKKLNSTAAGAYQINHDTWELDRGRLKLKDFSPHSQDIAALYEMNRKGALNYVLNGDIESAINKTNGVWVSLPGAKHDAVNKHSLTMGEAQEFYQASGGRLHGAGKNIPSNNVVQLNVPMVPTMISSAVRNYLPGYSVPYHTRAEKPFMIPTTFEGPLRPGTLKEINGEIARGKTKALTEYLQKSTLFKSLPQQIKNGIQIGNSSVGKKLQQGRDGVKGQRGSNNKNDSVNVIQSKKYPGIDRQMIQNKFMINPGGKNGSMYYPLNNPYKVPLTDPVTPKLSPVFPGTGIPFGSSGITHPENSPGKYSSFFAPADGDGAWKNDAGDDMLSKPFFSDIDKQSNDTSFADGNTSQTVNINLNTPMIGSFTINAKDMGAGLNDLKNQIEGVLLEILNSANAIV